MKTALCNYLFGIEAIVPRSYQSHKVAHGPLGIVLMHEPFQTC
jgi:hypothetical protein